MSNATLLQWLKSRPAYRWNAPGTDTILIADYDQIVRRFVRIVLELVGFAVHEACEFTSALEPARAEQRPLSLAIIDLGMAGAFRLSAGLSVISPNVKILFTSSGYDLSVIRKLIPPEEFLEKPFTPATLVSAVEDALSPPNREHRQSDKEWAGASASLLLSSPVSHC